MLVILYCIFVCTYITVDAQAEKRHLHGVPVAQPFPLTPQFYEGMRKLLFGM